VEIAALLQKVNILSHLDLKQRLELADYFTFASFQSDDDIFLLDEYPLSFSIMAKGKRNKTFLFFLQRKEIILFR
jgi:hypothetical protein